VNGYEIYGSTDGKEWVIFGKAKSIYEARQKASNLILRTKHMQVKILEEE